MMPLKPVTRRSFITGATLGSASIFVRSLRAADFTFTQYYNQPANSSLHRRLTEMWAAIRTETGGRVETQVFAENNKLQGSDPAALKMLVSGEIQFFTLMGGPLSSIVPVADVQQVPYSFRSSRFNLMANLSIWQRLPDDVKAVIDRNAAKYVRLQRQDQESMNTNVRADLVKRGLVFNNVNPAPFRAKRASFYVTWKEKLGTGCWSLLEAEVGRLG